MQTPRLSVAELRAKINGLPRFSAARLPTPLDRAPRLSEALGVEILIKREDMTGLAFGGNKTRELDFFIGDALAKHATVFIAGGGAAQSNHAVQCSAAARRAGLLPVMVLHRFRADEIQGNLLLDHLMAVDVRLMDGAAIDSAIDARTALEREMHKVAAEYRQKGHSPYILPSSFHVLGAVGYVDAAAELFEQIGTLGRDIHHVYVTSAGATQVGLAVGLKTLGSGADVRGISYTVSSNELVPRMITLGRQVTTLLDLPTVLADHDIQNESYSGPGYGIPTDECVSAIKMVAELEGMFLDPVYSGKGMAGLIDHVRKGIIKQRETVVFVHTGGLPGIFAYHRELTRPPGIAHLRRREEEQ